MSISQTALRLTPVYTPNSTIYRTPSGSDATDMTNEVVEQLRSEYDKVLPSLMPAALYLKVKQCRFYLFIYLFLLYNIVLVLKTTI